MSNQFQLMREQRFRPFFFTQFLGAFNDNVFKTALITLVTFRAGQLTMLDGKMLATLLPGLFILPFFLFSATSGQIADKYEKSMLVRLTKCLEIGIMLLAAWGFMARSFWPLVAALFLMGAQSTLFGPVKYAYLPQHLREEELIGGNGMVEMGTFVAILAGEILGAWLAMANDGALLTSATVIAVAVAGYWVSRGVPHSPAADPQLRINWNPVSETWRNLKFAHGNRTVWLSLLGTSWFWFYGATILAQFPTFTKDVLHGDESVFILLLTVFSLGIGIGSLLCEKLSGGKVEIGLVPFGAIGLTVFGVDLYWASLNAGAAGLPAGLAHGAYDFLSALGQATHWRVLLDIALLGLFGGFYIVPLYALIQTRSEKSHQSRIIAANNILNALFMVISAVVSMALFALGLSIPQLFLATALFNIVVAAYIYRLVPEFLIRFVVWLLVHSVYRLEKRGIERVPESGGALLVSNHTSLADVLLITAASVRPPRFAIDPRHFARPLLGAVLREGRAIPLPGEAGQAGEAARNGAPSVAMQTAQAAIESALAAGEIVVVFPEAGAEADGQVRPFCSWFAALLEALRARHPTTPVLPLALHGLEDSAFAAARLRLGQRLARLRPFRRVAVTVGAPQAASAAAAESVRQALCFLADAQTVQSRS